MPTGDAIELKKRICALLYQFPENCCCTMRVDRHTPTDKIYIKYHIIPMNPKEFDNILVLYLDLGESTFVEHFHDTEDFSNIRQRHCMITTCYSLHGERVSYCSNKKFRVNRDYEEFQEGDFYCVYTLQAELDETKWQEIVFNLELQKIKPKPVRECLYRHQIIVYKSLEKSKHIPTGMHFDSEFIIPKQVDYHPNGKISQWRRSYMKETEILEKNLGIDVSSLFNFNTNRTSWYIFDHVSSYCPKTISILSASCIDVMAYQSNFESFFISEVLQTKIDKAQDQIYHCTFVNIFGYYCIDLYLKENHFTVYDLFKKEIDSGFVRIHLNLPNISDRNHAKHLVTINGELLGMLPEILKQDKEIVTLAVQQNFMSLRFASDILLKDSHFILELVQLQGLSLIFAHADLLNDSNIVLKAVQQNGWLVNSTLISEKMKNITRVMTSAYFQRLETLENISKSIACSKDVEISFNAKECTIEVFDNGIEERTENRLHLGLIVIPVKFLKLEEETFERLSLSAPDFHCN